MTFAATKQHVANRGTPPDAFLAELVKFGKTAPRDIFARTATVGTRDIFNKVFAELGPYTSDIHRVAVVLEVDRVLAGFESSWVWTEGVDTSRLGADTPENAEAGAWQVSYDARRLDSSLQDWCIAKGLLDGVVFQRKMKFDHFAAMEFVARLMRVNTRHNGPLYKGDERLAIRQSLRGAEHSIYPWLRRDAVTEFVTLLA